MKTKIFEVLDRATCMPVIATKLDLDLTEFSKEEIGINLIQSLNREKQLLDRLGLGHEQSYKILLSVIGSAYVHSQIDAYAWSASRTCHQAHKYIEEHFDTLENGAVVDVEFILGECDAPHQSDLDFDILDAANEKT